MADAFPKLVILTGPEEGEEYSLQDKEILKVGRSDDNDIALSDSSLSRHHAKFHIKEGVWQIVDESSRNGSFVNEHQLQPGRDRALKHNDVIRFGAYDFRFLESADGMATHISDSEEKTDKSMVTDVDIPLPEGDSKAFDEDEVEEESVVMETDKEELNRERDAAPYDTALPKMGQSMRVFVIIAVLFAILGFGIHYIKDKSDSKHQSDDSATPALKKKLPVAQENQNKEEVSDAAEEEKSAVKSTEPSEEKTQVAETPTTSEKTKEEAPQEPQEPTTSEGSDSEIAALKADDAKEDGGDQNAKEFFVFLEVKTEPMPATIYLNGKRIGKAPFKESVAVDPSQTQEIWADFELRDLNDVYRKKAEFQVKPDADVIELNISAELGVLRIQKLPRRVDFYLEGFYAHDKLKADPVKINDITYGKPIFLPYGQYHMELKERTNVAGSENSMTQIRYQRDYVVSEENKEITVAIFDKDLQFFPAVIKSEPTRADVIRNGEKIGETPFKGLLPVGDNQIQIKKEGYFTKTISVAMQMNSIFEKNVVLQTSKIGRLINDAKNKIRHQEFDEAITILSNALKYGGAEKEKAEVYYLLGASYLRTNKTEQAKPYFEKAKTHPQFKQEAQLGLAKAYHHEGNKNLALRTIVAVLANITAETPARVRTEANNIFRKISPVKSVMYIYTEPKGANLFVNDQKIAQTTPVILSDLTVGNYRLQVEKPGYQVYQTKQNLKVGEFIVVKIDLKKEKL
ncbi:MAG: PEGA domain-containing protein [Deltaproteobacteria bacterium]|nr:PEGA domain-containing protein [Deltaproteobacteria bacterium]